TISVNLYTLEELAPEVEQKVVERESSINVDDSFWYESIIEDWTEELQQCGFEQVKILFSGFGSQGDGACFEARINMAAYLTAHHLKATYPLLAKYPEYVEVSLKHRGMYYHERSTHLVPYFNAEIVDPNGSGISDEETRVEKEYEALEKDLYQEVVRLGRSIYTVLEEEYFHQISAEAVQDTLIANVYTYLADGRPFTISSPAYGR
ncbi:MAG TPA: hypothetical protein VLQ80_05215, partial [Candidatus Saccharimonadia bacterium]|nr:hypothetical protein [Candidatus Saccharimonadia bacterium]